MPGIILSLVWSLIHCHHLTFYHYQKPVDHLTVQLSMWKTENVQWSPPNIHPSYDNLRGSLLWVDITFKTNDWNLKFQWHPFFKEKKN